MFHYDWIRNFQSPKSNVLWPVFNTLIVMSHVAEMLVKLSLHSLWVTITASWKTSNCILGKRCSFCVNPVVLQMLTFSYSLLDMSGQSQIFQINKKETSVLITEKLSKFMDANIEANRLNSGQQSPLSPPPSPHLPCVWIAFLSLTCLLCQINRHFY